jgi:excisionase family DNA binding protein
MTTERLTYDLWPEAGERLGLSRNGTYDAAKRGDIPIIRIGKRILVPKAALERLLTTTGEAFAPK